MVELDCMGLADGWRGGQLGGGWEASRSQCLAVCGYVVFGCSASTFSTPSLKTSLVSPTASATTTAVESTALTLASRYFCARTRFPRNFHRYRWLGSFGGTILPTSPLDKTCSCSLLHSLAFEIQQKWRRPSPLSRRGRRCSSVTSRTATLVSRSRGGSPRVSTTACVDERRNGRGR